MKSRKLHQIWNYNSLFLSLDRSFKSLWRFSQVDFDALFHASCRYSADSDLFDFISRLSTDFFNQSQQVIRSKRRIDRSRVRMILKMTENEIVEFYRQKLNSVAKSRKQRERNLTSSRKKYFKTKRKLQCILEYRIRQDIYKKKFSLPSQVFSKMIDMITGSTETAL